MLEKIYIQQPKNMDLNMYRCGVEDCKPSHFWGPAVRDHYIIHLIHSGKGIFQANGKTFNLTANDGFLICPGTVIFYKADMEEPWSYSWVGFHGMKAEAYIKQAGLTSDHPVFTYNRDSFLEQCLSNMIAAKDMKKGREIRLLGLLYIFLSQLVEISADTGTTGRESRKETYIKKAVEYITSNYHKKLSISEIAHFVGLDRSYLYNLFQEHLNMSLQDFLISYRLDKACELLGDTSLTIGDISRSVGYEDPLVFSKAFKKVKGVSPRKYRKGG